jgi:hypothetical protein
MLSPSLRILRGGNNRLAWKLVVLLSVGWLSFNQAFHVGGRLPEISSRGALVFSEGRIVGNCCAGMSTRVGIKMSRTKSVLLETRIFSRKGDDDEDVSSDVENSFPFLAVALPLVGLVALWPLLALFRDTNDPTSGFDIDMYMALKGILDTGNGGTGMMMVGDEIIELPRLSPAEQLVGAIFGPP